MRGERGVEIVRSKLPQHWVVRELSPDYGLDLHVEVFEPPADDAPHADALGEHFFAQVKTVASRKEMKLTVKDRLNVAKFRRSSEAPSSGDRGEQIGVVSYSLDTAELRTVEAMGASLAVLLFIVDETTEEVIFVCLNDYINKVLLPEHGPYAHQDSWTIHVPVFNRLDAKKPEFTYIRLLAKRPKLYGAFSTFTYQVHELRVAISDASETTPQTVQDLRRTRVGEMLEVFVAADLRLDIWGSTGVGFWSPLRDVHRALLLVEEGIREDGPAAAEEMLSLALRTFTMAAGLGRMYEELCREWRLPTALAAAILHAESGDPAVPS